MEGPSEFRQIFSTVTWNCRGAQSLCLKRNSNINHIETVCVWCVWCVSECGRKEWLERFASKVHYFLSEMKLI